MTFQILVFVSICIIITHISDVICYKEFVNKYERVNFQILEERTKRSAIFSSNLTSSNKKPDLEIKFTSYGKNFHLILSEDELFQEMLVEFPNTFRRTVHPKTKFYEGFLQDDYNSSVICFLSDADESLTAQITDSNYTYFAEPDDVFFNNSSLTPYKIVVYRNVDIRRPAIFPQTPENYPEWEVLYRTPNISLNITVESSGLDIFNQTENVYCEIELVADHTLYNFYHNNTDRLIAIMYYHGKFADYIFRRADFNMDGKADDIRINVGKISIYESNKNDNYPMNEASSISDYLSLFTLRQQKNEYCLSIGMFYRQYDGFAIGEAFKPEFLNNNAIGGICDQPLPINIGLGDLSFNTGVINMQFQTGEPIPLGVTMLAFAHELGHGFGSAHDPIDHSVCSPGKVENFLMYPLSSYGSINSMKFSNCSLREIKNALLVKGSCLKSRVSKCGNGVREHDEECDCGDSTFCNLIDPCCTPSDAKAPEKPCTIRSQKGFECSPKESECCDRNCSIAGSENVLCSSDIPKCLYSFCDGKSPKCPELQVMPKFCAPKLTCNSTSCVNMSVCESAGFEDCLCTDYLSNQCVQCCFKNACIPASELGIFDFDGKPFILQSGTSCNNRLYECDGKGNCISRLLKGDTTKELYISMIVLPVFGLILVIFALFASCRKAPENNITTVPRNTLW